MWSESMFALRKVSSVDQAVIDLVEGVSIWGVPGLEVDSFVHEVRTFDRHLPACGKVDQFAGCACLCLSLADVRFLPGQLLRSPLPSPTSCHDWGKLRIPAPAVHKNVDERVVEESAFYSNYAETLVDSCKVFNHVVKIRIQQKAVPDS
jgi:hypothetical protein